VVPSSCSRRMSACPACRAVSLVMWAMTHRSVCRLPSTGTAKRVRVTGGPDRAVAVLDGRLVVPQHVGCGAAGGDGHAVFPGGVPGRYRRRKSTSAEDRSPGQILCTSSGTSQALSAAGYGLTQTLAAAPQMVARWENARAAAPYAWAVLTAALDAALYRFRTRCRVSESLAEKLLEHGG